MTGTHGRVGGRGLAAVRFVRFGDARRSPAARRIAWCARRRGVERGGAMKASFRVSPDGVHWYGGDDAAGASAYYGAVLTELAPFSGRRRAACGDAARPASADTRGRPTRALRFGPAAARVRAVVSDGETWPLPPADVARGAAFGGGTSRWAEVELALNGQNFVGGRDDPPSTRDLSFSSAPTSATRGASLVVDDAMPNGVPGAHPYYLEVVTARRGRRAATAAPGGRPPIASSRPLSWRRHPRPHPPPRRRPLPPPPSGRWLARRGSRCSTSAPRRGGGPRACPLSTPMRRRAFARARSRRTPRPPPGPPRESAPRRWRRRRGRRRRRRRRRCRW